MATTAAVAGCGEEDRWSPAPEPLHRAAALTAQPVPDLPRTGPGPDLGSIDRPALFDAGDGRLGVTGSGRYAAIVRTWTTDGRTWRAVGDATGPLVRAARAADGRLCGSRSDDVPLCVSADGRTVRTLDRPPAHPDHPDPADGRDRTERRRWAQTIAVGDDVFALVEDRTRRTGYLVRVDGRRQVPVGDAVVGDLGVVLAPREDRAPCVVGAAWADEDAGDARPARLRLTVACPGARTRRVDAPLTVPSGADDAGHGVRVARRLVDAVVVGRTVVAGISNAWETGVAADRRDAGATWTVVAGAGRRLRPVAVGGSVGDGRVGGDLHVADGRVWALRRATTRSPATRTGRIDLLRIDPRSGSVDGRATLVDDGPIQSGSRSAGVVVAAGDRVWVAAQAAGAPAPADGSSRATTGRIGWRLWALSRGR